MNFIIKIGSEIPINKPPLVGKLKWLTMCVCCSLIKLLYNIAVVTSNVSWLPILASFLFHWAGNEDIHLASFPGCSHLQHYTGDRSGLGMRLG